MTIRLCIPIKAEPHQSVRMTRSGHAYQPKKITDYKKKIQEAVRDQLPDGFSPIKENTKIFISKLHYVFKYPSSTPKYKKQQDEILYKVTKPDLHDNLNKALFDALEGVVWERDQNVVGMDNVRKYYGEEDNILIVIDTQC